MKNKITGMLVVSFFTLVNNVSFSQPNLTINNYNFWITAGNKINTYFDQSTTSVNIGNTGQSSWDFSGLHVDKTYQSAVIKPNTTPYRPDYPKSDFTFEYRQGEDHNYEFFCHSNNYIHLHGIVYTNSSTPGQSIKFVYNPVKIFVYLPSTYNTTWRDTVTEAVKLVQDTNVVSSDTFKVVTNAVVDAYGPVTFPGGRTVNALRARIQQVRTGSSTTESKVIYQWFTETGETLIIEADAGAPSSGNITPRNIKWMINEITTDVADSRSAIPASFSLGQNYPNPFNPSTSVSYSLPEEANVKIMVYNTIGREIATLVDEKKAAGSYSVSFNGTGLTSGIYFLKMSAGNFNKVIKMTMVK